MSDTNKSKDAPISAGGTNEIIRKQQEIAEALKKKKLEADAKKGK